MTEEEKKAIEYLKNCLNDEYDFKNATRKKDKECYEIILNLIQKQDTEINKLNNVIDRMAEVLNDFDYDTQCIKEYFMKENTGDHIPRID